LAKKLVKFFLLFYIGVVFIDLKTIAIKTFRNNRYGPGGSSQHLHQVYWCFYGGE